MSGLDLYVFATDNPDKFRLSIRDSRGACCGENRPDWLEVGYLNRKQARLAIRHGIAGDRAPGLVPRQREKPRVPGQPVVHALKASIKLDLTQQKSK